MREPRCKLVFLRYPVEYTLPHICRPRDGEWECIEGERVGASSVSRHEDGTSTRPFWINADGTYQALSAIEHERLLGDEYQMYEVRNDQLMREGDPWVDVNGNFVELTEERLNQEGPERMSIDDKARYRLALARQRAGLPPDHGEVAQLPQIASVLQ